MFDPSKLDLYLENSENKNETKKTNNLIHTEEITDKKSDILKDEIIQEQVEINERKQEVNLSSAEDSVTLPIDPLAEIQTEKQEKPKENYEDFMKRASVD